MYYYYSNREPGHTNWAAWERGMESCYFLGEFKNPEAAKQAMFREIEDGGGLYGFKEKPTGKAAPEDDQIAVDTRSCSEAWALRMTWEDEGVPNGLWYWDNLFVEDKRSLDERELYNNDYTLFDDWNAFYAEQEQLENQDFGAIKTNTDTHWEVVMVSSGGVKEVLAGGFPSEKDAIAFAEKRDWTYRDENGFEWGLEVREAMEKYQVWDEEPEYEDEDDYEMEM